MNTLEDDLRTVLRRQADAMRVPTPKLGQPLARVTPLAPRGERRWLLPAAAVVLIAVGGLALMRRGNPEAPLDSASEQPAAPPEAPFVFETPTVRLSADSIEVTVGGNVYVPTDATVHSDPGSGEYTTLELTWVQDGVEHRLYIYFTSDGTNWWADAIRTDASTPDEWISSAEGERWFTSALGTAWTGNVELPNLRITNMTLEAFLRPAACDNPTSPIAVVSAYPTIDGFAFEGSGFGGRIDLIDTATCTAIDAAPYIFTATVDDTSIAIVSDEGPVPSTTIVEGGPVGTDPTPGELFGRIDLKFVAAGETTLRVTVTDASGTVIGTVAVPVRVQEQTTTTTIEVP